MATNESGSDSRGKPANDSIDELLDGLPADPILPKKRARPMDQARPQTSLKRRADDERVVGEGTETSFRGPNATRQKWIVGVVMMLAVLGIYAFMRAMRKNAAPQNVQNTSNSSTPAASQSAAAASSAAPSPSMSAASATIAPPASSAFLGTARHSHLRTDGHAVPSSNVAQGAPSARSAGFSGL